jgi:hypothetical protein
MGRACNKSGVKRNANILLVAKPEGKDEEQDAVGWIILRWILER